MLKDYPTGCINHPLHTELLMVLQCNPALVIEKRLEKSVRKRFNGKFNV